MDLELGGKRALVTGGSRGIGKQVARQLAAEGATVALAARDKDRLDAAAKEIAAESGQTVVGFSVDTRDDASVIATVNEVKQSIGGVDILVNCAAQPAGQGSVPSYDKVTSDALFEEINTKFMGYLRCIQAVAPMMIESGWGRIINVSGLAARRTGSIIGSARNIAVASMTKNLADDLGRYGINVNVVHPGATRTEVTTKEREEQLAGTNLVGKLVDAEEVASVITFLCSPRAVAIQGDTITAGGGHPGIIYY